MTIDAWVTLTGISATLGFGLIGLWVKTKSEIQVMKSEIIQMKDEANHQQREHRDLMNRQIELESKILGKLTDLTAMVYRVEGKLDSKADKK